MPDMQLKLHETRLKKPPSPIQRYIIENGPKSEEIALQQARSDKQLLDHEVQALFEEYEQLMARHELLHSLISNRSQQIADNIVKIKELRELEAETEKSMQDRAYKCIGRVHGAGKQLDVLLNFMDQRKLRRALIRINRALSIESCESFGQDEDEMSYDVSMSE